MTENAEKMLTIPILKANGITNFRGLPMVEVATEDKTDEVLNRFKQHLVANKVEPVCSFSKEGDYILLRSDDNYYLWMPDDDYCKLGSREDTINILKTPERHDSLSFSSPTGTTDPEYDSDEEFEKNYLESDHDWLYPNPYFERNFKKLKCGPQLQQILRNLLDTIKEQKGSFYAPAIFGTHDGQVEVVWTKGRFFIKSTSSGYTIRLYLRYEEPVDYSSEQIDQLIEKIWPTIKENS